MNSLAAKAEPGNQTATFGCSMGTKRPALTLEEP